MCLMALEETAEAREHCEQLLEVPFTDYYAVLDLYISLLLQTEDYNQVIETLEVEVDHPDVPEDMVEEFYHVLDFAIKKYLQKDRKPI